MPSYFWYFVLGLTLTVAPEALDVASAVAASSALIVAKLTKTMVNKMPMAECAFNCGLTAVNVAGLSFTYVPASRVASSDVMHHLECTPLGY